ncbi:MAG: DEAD/DEAH box helicase [Propionibacteriaceae bacterium]|nr:DEAD/DEAH box helicase [Propionibacteriaceae bacterium]
MATSREKSSKDLPILRQWFRDGRTLEKTLHSCLDGIEASKNAVHLSHQDLVARKTRARMESMDLSILRDSTQGRLSLSPLRNQGFTTVGQIMFLREQQLRAIPGVGAATCRSLMAACATLWDSLAKEMSVRIDFDPTDQQATKLLQSLQRYAQVRALSSNWLSHLGDLSYRLTLNLGLGEPIRPVRWLVTRGSKRTQVLDSLWRIRDILDQDSTKEAHRVAHEVIALTNSPHSDPWPSFETRAADFYSLLAEFVPTTTPLDATQGYLTDEIVAQVNAQGLDQSLLNVNLRGYQVFGAKFALVQRRVILGDEMGLGKTIQALAGLCHRLAQARESSEEVHPSLVICPASVMANWGREITVRTALEYVEIHGYDRQDEVDEWLEKRCIGVTTFDTMKGLRFPSSLRLGVLIVDEAHYAKNPRTGRSRMVKTMCDKADYVWFLTGTPMENRVEEFTTLVRYLQSDVLPPGKLPTTALAFRQAVSPVYLRRNAVDVLQELPPRIDQDEWVFFTPADLVAYASAVRSGNLMAMRQAGYEADFSAKLTRFIELVEEASANGLKVVAYSFFLNTLSRAELASPIKVFGPLTGEISPKKRQSILDDFTTHSGPALLLGQIKVGGVGLNIQAASVVILLEPQLTPTSEDQAIARSHRMGQVRPIQVYRILAENSIDQSLVELLASKTKEFDQYARHSEVAARSGQAIDVSFEGLNQQLVSIEQARDLA